MTRSPRAVAVLVAALAAGAAGCEPPDGPALEVFLQVVRARPDLDTSDVTGFLVQINDDETAIPFDDTATVPIVLDDPPTAPTTIVVYACTLSAQCEERFGVFVGCTIEDLAPAAEPIAITVTLDARDDTVPAACEGLVDPLTSG